MRKETETIPAIPAILPLPEGANLHPLSDAMRAELLQVEESVLFRYTLADAMREGSKVSGQLFGGYITDGRSCALGAAVLSAKARGYA